MRKWVHLMQYRSFLLTLLIPLLCFSTSIVRVSLEEAVNQADWIVSGDVVRTWCDWDSAHRFIWTHTEVAVREKWKGTPGSTVTISEPGGVMDGKRMTIVGMVAYAPGEHVVVFLQRTPVGLIRTVGLTQGKLLVDTRGLVHPSAAGAELVSARGLQLQGTPIGELEGRSVGDVRARISSLAATGNGVRK
jgi:hypothetical protein